MALLIAEEEHTLDVETVIHLIKLHLETQDFCSKIYLDIKDNLVLLLFSKSLSLQLSFCTAVGRRLGLDEL